MTRKLAMALAATLCMPGDAGAQCNFQKSGPITVSADGQYIHDFSITSTAGPGIDTNGHSYITIYNVAINHGSGPGVIINGGHDVLIQNAAISGTSAYSGSNIACHNSSTTWISNSKLSKGYRGVDLNYCNGTVISGLEGHDQSGLFPGGQLVVWINSTNGSLSNFSNLNVPPNTSQGDTINAWRSSNISVSDGVVDGNYTPNGVGVEADEATYNMTVSNIDAIHMMDGGFAAYGASGSSVVFSNVRVRDTVCNSSQGLPSSGSIAFIGPCTIADKACTTPKWNVSFDNAAYYNLCNPATPTFNQVAMSRTNFTYADFVPRTPFKASVCP